MLAKDSVSMRARGFSVLTRGSPRALPSLWRLATANRSWAGLATLLYTAVPAQFSQGAAALQSMADVLRTMLAILPRDGASPAAVVSHHRLTARAFGQTGLSILTTLPAEIGPDVSEQHRRLIEQLLAELRVSPMHRALRLACPELECGVGAPVRVCHHADVGCRDVDGGAMLLYVIPLSAFAGLPAAHASALEVRHGVGARGRDRALTRKVGGRSCATRRRCRPR
jgi:hypothetical protein